MHKVGAFLVGQNDDSFLANVPASSLVHPSDFASLKIESVSVLRGRQGVDSILRELEKGANSVLSKVGLRSEFCWAPTLLGGWWSLGYVCKEWLTLEMFWLDHEFGLGKHGLKFSSRNEAEFTMWCLKTFTFAKCLSNPSHLPVEGKSYALSHSESSRDAKGLYLASLVCCLD